MPSAPLCDDAKFIAALSDVATTAGTQSSRKTENWSGAGPAAAFERAVDLGW
jgi:hypothetical protein